MKPPAPVGAAATALGPRKLAVPAKSKGKLGTGMGGSSTSSVAGPSSAATKTQQRLALPSMAPMETSPELGFGGLSGGLSPDLGQVAAMVAEVAEERHFARALQQVPLVSPTIRGASGSLTGSVASLGPSVSTTRTTTAASATVGKGGRCKKGVSVKRAIQAEEEEEEEGEEEEDPNWETRSKAKGKGKRSKQRKAGTPPRMTPKEPSLTRMVEAGDEEQEALEGEEGE